MTAQASRVVQLPLERLDKCMVCTKTTSLRLCSGCSERIYCSAECQKADWRAHKPRCQSIEYIELTQFWPFLATLAEGFRIHPVRTDLSVLHHAVQHQVVNEDINPTSPPTALPDGSFAKLLILGSHYDMSGPWRDLTWAIHAESPKVESKLRRRILREGDVLPILVAICTALAGTIYAKSDKASIASIGHEEGWRQGGDVRLRYRSSPIADFGICAGTVRVTSPDRLAYYDLNTATLTKGQDPEHHFWLYFRTLKGEDIYLELCMFTFNMCLQVATEPYIAVPGFPSLAPAFFCDCIMNRGMGTAQMHTEHSRESALRSPLMRRVVAECGTTIRGNGLARFMRVVTGRQPSDREIELATTFTNIGLHSLEDVLASGRWKTFPKEPPLSIERDPNEDDTPVEVTVEQQDNIRKRWKKLLRKGLITREQLESIERDFVVV